MSEHLVRKKQLGLNPTDLKDFANQVETALKTARGPRAMVNIIARLLTCKDPRIAALMACKWVEWRYGKPKDPDVAGAQLAIQIINHIPRPGAIAPAPEAIAGSDLGPEIAREPGENGETRIIQSEPKSKQ